MMCGIALTIDPRHADAVIMMTILDTFLQDRAGLHDMDPTTRREIRIIQFLKTSAVTPNGGVISNGKLAGDPESEAKQHAGLLLGLHQSSNGLACLAPSSARSKFSSLAIGTGGIAQRPSHSQSTPSSPFSNIAQSPTLRLHSCDTGSTSNHTGSPIEDESDAQKLFDRWCNTMGGDSHGQFWDPVLTQWPAMSGQDAFTGLASQPSYALNDTLLPSDVEGGDGSFWETLVNQIREGGGVRVNEV